MKKRLAMILAAILCVILVSLSGTAAQAAKPKGVDRPANFVAGVGVPSANVYTARVTLKDSGSSLNIRSTPGVKDDNLLDTIPNGKVISILSREADGWFRVRYKDMAANKDITGYVSGGYLEDNKNVAYTTADLNLRSSADSSSPSNILKTLSKNTKVEVIQRSDSWTLVNYQGTIGFVSSNLLKSTNEDNPAPDPNAPKTIDLKNVHFYNRTVYYDGKYHSMPQVSNLPKNVKVVYSTTEKHRGIGTYSVKATFKAARSQDKLVNAGPKYAKLIITVKANSVYGVDDLKVRILKANTAGKGTVRVIGPRKDKKTVKKLQIPGKVKIGGIPFKVTEIGIKSFAECKNLVDLRVGNNVKIIHKKAFAYCPKLAEARLGRNLVTIDDSVFRDCTSLGKIYVRSKLVKKVGTGAFAHIKKGGYIKVNAARLKKYKKLFAHKGQGSTVEIR